MVRGEITVKGTEAPFQSPEKDRCQGHFKIQGPSFEGGKIRTVGYTYVCPCMYSIFPHQRF